MACPDDTALARLLDATLPAAGRVAIEGHLDGCARCSDLVAELAGRVTANTRVSHVCTVCGSRYPSPGTCRIDGAEVRSTADPLVGRDAGAYRILHPLGSGGMGRVYAAVHREVASRVAIKVINLDHSDDPELVKRFFLEARAVNRIQHAGVVKVIDLLELPDRRPAIVMERIDGPTLRTAQVTTARAVVDVLADVLAALSAAHAMGIVHRDLKPDNVILSPSGPKLLDFGIAKVVDLPTNQPAPRTATNACLGTPGYMAPEQILGGPTDARSDIYAVGVIAFELLAGRRPFAGTSDFEVMRGHLEHAPPELCALRPDVPPALARAIDRALAKRPEERFATAADFAQAMQSAVGTASAHRPRGAGRWIAVIAAIAIAIPITVVATRHSNVAITTPPPVAPPVAPPVMPAPVPLPAAPSPSSDGFFASAPAHLDPVAYVPTALALARRFEPDAELVTFVANGVRADGTFAAETSARSERGIVYKFVSPVRARELATAARARCEITVVVTSAGTLAAISRKVSTQCPSQLATEPRCTAAQVWAKAIARGVPADAVAQLSWDTRWAFSVKPPGRPQGFVLADDC